MAIQENRSHLVFQTEGISCKGIALWVISQTTDAETNGIRQ